MGKVPTIVPSDFFMVTAGVTASCLALSMNPGHFFGVWRAEVVITIISPASSVHAPLSQLVFTAYLELSYTQM
jgi:hypothetical protein